jgi:phage terminase small subunit
MPITARQEAFAQGIVSGKSQSDAYRTAYPNQKASAKTVTEAACRLMTNSNVVARVKELREPILEKMAYGLQDAMRETLRALELAEAKGHTTAMIMATNLRSKLNGLLVERREVAVLTEVQRLDDDELDRLIALKAREAGLASDSSMH